MAFVRNDYLYSLALRFPLYGTMAMIMNDVLQKLVVLPFLSNTRFVCSVLIKYLLAIYDGVYMKFIYLRTKLVVLLYYWEASGT